MIYINSLTRPFRAPLSPRVDATVQQRFGELSVIASRFVSTDPTAATKCHGTSALSHLSIVYRLNFTYKHRLFIQTAKIKAYCT